MRFITLTALLALTVRPASATFPYPAPDVATPPQAYADYCRLPAMVPPVRPADFAGGDAWKLTSDATGDPAIDAKPEELFGVTGMSVDLAWQTSTGRPDVVLAVLDSGIKWNDVGAMGDVARKVRINRGELPAPRDAAGHTKSELPGPFKNPDPYDLNDDGVFNVADYAADARVTDANGNGLLDPQDLIVAFSDATDADGNGYVDDIAGWNFLDDDNDPFDEVQYGHGTGEARDSTAEADNGGDVGACPNCMVLPIRVGDSFIADSNLFAQAVVFAVDSGAHVVQEALGTVNNTSFARAAIEYAYANDVPVIASAADEESFHHNFPAANSHTIVVNSVTKFDDLAGFTMSPHSYLYLNGCTNYGGNIAVAIASSSCSSEATGKGAGIAGLLISAALDQADAGHLTVRRTDPTGARHPLSPNEVAQLFTMTADDIDFSNDRDVTFLPIIVTTKRYASQPGWDQYFGYGRANARTAIQAVAAGAIPPEADILTPGWWTTLDPVRTPTVAVTGSAAAPRSSGFGWELAFGCSVQPTDDAFTPIANVPNLTAPVAAANLATWSIADAATHCAFDPSAVATTAPSGTASPDDTPDMFTVTLRLRVTDADNRRGESRRTIYLHHDPELRPGYPRDIPGSGEPSPLFVRLRGRHSRQASELKGNQQLLVPTTDGVILALLDNGKNVNGWPVTTDLLPLHTGSRAFTSGALPVTFHESLGNGIAAADLDGDGRTEVVAGSLAGKLYVWNQDGKRRSGFPVATDPAFSARSARDKFNRLQRGLLAAPVLVDLDGDTKLDVVSAAMDRHIYAWHDDGSAVAGWPVLVVDRTMMASVDATSGHVVPKFTSGDGQALQGTKIVATPAVAPLLGDGKPVIVVGTNEEYRETPNFSSQGNSAVNLYLTLGLFSRANGRLYAIPAGGTGDASVASNPAGPYLPGWPAHVAVLKDNLLPWIEGVPGSPAMGDVDGDGKLEVAVAGVIGPTYVLKSDGTSFYGNGPDGRPVTLPSDQAAYGAQNDTTDAPSVAALGSPTFARIDGTMSVVVPAGGLGRLVDLAAAAQQLPHDAQVDAWNASTGIFLPGFPHVIDDTQFLTNPVVADVNGDGHAEILAGSGGYLLHAVDAHGVAPAGWPKFTGGWIIASPAVGPLGRRITVAVTTREGQLFVWRARSKPGSRAWPRFHHDPRNTGTYTDG